MSKGISPTQRTLKAMREQGRLVGIVERRLPIRLGLPYGKTVDLFGFIDLIALDPVQGVVAIQSCGQDFAGHVEKIMVERNEAVFEWLKHAPLELWGWRRVKLKRGGAAIRWAPRIADFFLTKEGEIKIRERK